MIGRIYGRYTVAHLSSASGYVVCRCACGTTKTVSMSTLRLGKSKSCGCLRRDRLRELRTTHDQSGSRAGSKKTKEYYAWANMKTRCYNEKSDDYAHYGGRGIIVCRRWVDSFEAFYADVGSAPSAQHSIDRINVNGNYEPDNVRWSTTKQQSLNKRNTRKYSYRRRRYTVAQIACMTGISEKTIRMRFSYGWSTERVINTPIRGD
jgi:hypothetical protein